MTWPSSMASRDTSPHEFKESMCCGHADAKEALLMLG
jgi:hypothetical protein